MSTDDQDKQAITIRVRREAYDHIRRLADSEKRSITKQIEWLIERAAAQAGPATLEPVAAQPEVASPA